MCTTFQIKGASRFRILYCPVRATSAIRAATRRLTRTPSRCGVYRISSDCALYSGSARYSAFSYTLRNECGVGNRIGVQPGEVPPVRFSGMTLVTLPSMQYRLYGATWMKPRNSLESTNRRHWSPCTLAGGLGFVAPTMKAQAAWVFHGDRRSGTWDP